MALRWGDQRLFNHALHDFVDLPVVNLAHWKHPFRQKYKLVVTG